MAKGTKTGGRNFKKGVASNPGGFTKEQAKAKRITRDGIADLLNVLQSATHEQMERILGNPETTALTMMVVKCYMNTIDTGDWKQFNLFLDRLVGKVKDEVEVGGTFTIKRFGGKGGVIMETGKKEDEDE